jgi:hypothetical protein
MPDNKLLLWVLRHGQGDLAEAIALYGFRRVKPLIEILINLEATR